MPQLEKNISTYPNNNRRKVISTSLLNCLLKRANHNSKNNVIEIIQFKQGEEIYRTGKNARSVYCVKHGIIKLIHPDETGKESMVRLIDDFDFFGILSLINNYKYIRNAIPIVETEVYRINSEFFMNALEEDIEISTLFSKFLLEILFVAELRINDLIVKSLNQRLAHFLITNAIIENGESVVKLNKKDIALITGTIQSTLSRRLALFVKQGGIKLSGKKIIITNMNVLLQMRS